MTSTKIETAKETLSRIREAKKKIETVRTVCQYLENAGIQPGDDTNETLAASKQILQDGMKMILKLPTDEANVLIARFVDGIPFSYMEDHDLLKGLSHKTCIRLQARAISHLADMIDIEGS